MFADLKRDAVCWTQKIRESPAKTLLVPCCILFLSFLFRIFSGGTATFYSLLLCKGFFPGAFLYTLGHIVRMLCAGLILTGVLFCRGLFELRLRAFACAIVTCLVLLVEYRIIFVSMSPVLALLLCAASIAAVFLNLKFFLKSCCPGACPALVLLLLQMIFFIQLIFNFLQDEKNSNICLWIRF